MKKRKKGFIIPLERAIVWASKAAGKNERNMKNIRRDFANIGTSEEESFHVQKNLDNFEKCVGRRKLFTIP
jgi:hypothetical protein